MMICLYFTLASISVAQAQPDNKPAMCAGCSPILGEEWLDRQLSANARDIHNYLFKWGYPLEGEDPFTSSRATRDAILSRIPGKKVFYFIGHGGLDGWITVFLAWDGKVKSYEITPPWSYFFVFLNACKSILLEDMAQAFITCYGIGCYVGWTYDIWSNDAIEFSLAFFGVIDLIDCSVYEALIAASFATEIYGWGYYGVAELIYLKSGMNG